MRPMSASARYRPLLAWRLKSKSFGHTRKRTRVVASKSTWDFPIRLKPTRNKRSQGNIEAVPFVSQVYSNEAPSLSRNEVVRMTSAQWIGLAILAVARVTWQDGTTSDRPVRKLGKVATHGWIFAIPPSVRKDMENRLLQMTGEKIDPEIARVYRKVDWH